MDETGQEDTRPGSGHSDDGSEEGGFVEVTREDAQLALQQQQQEPLAPTEEDEEEVDLYGDAEGGGLEDEEKVRGMAATPSGSLLGGGSARWPRSLGSCPVQTTRPIPAV